MIWQFSDLEILHPVSCQVSPVLNTSYSFGRYLFWIVFLFVFFFHLPLRLAFKITCLVQIDVFDKTCAFQKLHSNNIEAQQITWDWKLPIKNLWVSLSAWIDTFFSVFEHFLLCSGISPTCSCKMVFRSLDLIVQNNYDREQFWKHTCSPAAWNSAYEFSSTISGTDSNLKFKWRQRHLPDFSWAHAEDFA